jgi:hypothetical protein
VKLSKRLVMFQKGSLDNIKKGQEGTSLYLIDASCGFCISNPSHA